MTRKMLMAAVALSAALATGALTGCQGGSADDAADSAAETVQPHVSEDLRQKQETKSAAELGLTETGSVEGITFPIDPNWGRYELSTMGTVYSSIEVTDANVIYAEGTLIFAKTFPTGTISDIDSIRDVVSWDMPFGEFFTREKTWQADDGLHMMDVYETDYGVKYVLEQIVAKDRVAVTFAKTEDDFDKLKASALETSFDASAAPIANQEQQSPSDAAGIDPTTTQVAPARYAAGMYKVGTDLPAGEYKLTSQGDDAYWAVTNSSDADADIVGNNIFTGMAYVTVYDGQYLELRRCYAEPAA